MDKRLHVTLSDAKFREIQKMARSKRMSLAEWARQALDQARHREHLEGISKKLAVIRAAAQHTFPTRDIDEALSEIEKASNKS